MLTYHIRVELSNGRVLEFDVSAKNTEQARQFGLSTAKQMCSSRNIKANIKSISVEEFYDDADGWID